MQIKIFTTGGSIDKTYSTAASDFIVGEPQAGVLLREGNVNLEFEVESLLKKDSLAITDDDRAMILERVRQDAHERIVITHGTDTMTVTAKTLASIPGKVIVLTGAMQPAAFKKTDAVLNLGAAITAVQILPPGVYIAMSGRIFAYDKTRKNITTDQFDDI